MVAYRNVMLVSLLCMLLVGCLPAPYYQAQEPIPQNAWSYNYRPSFTFDVTDSNAVYQPFFIIRHSQGYPYNNIWLWVYVKTPGDTTAKKVRINIPLAEQTGKWLGRGMGEIYEQRMKIAFGDSVTTFRRPGTYKISLEQNMRVNPLSDILNVGFRLEKYPIGH